MSFLRRLLGRVEEPPQEPRRPALAWFDLPPGGSFEIAGAGHHRDVLAELFPPTAGEPDRVMAVAELVTEPDNPYDEDAVAVLIEGRKVGYIPAGTAPDWADLLGRLEDEGYRCRATASVWVGEHAWFVRLLARADADYLTPAGAGAAAREKAETAAAKEAARGAKAAAGAAVVEGKARAISETPPGICRDCGKPIERVPGQRGRPPVRCIACRGVSPAGQAGTAPVSPDAPVAEPLPQPVAARADAAKAPVLPSRRIPWNPIFRPADWAVIDVETTGIYAKYDRIVEVAVVRLGSDGREIDAWTTMVDPARDMGATEIHGIRASDVRGAPVFGDIAPELLARLGGARVAAHNARFDIDFIDADLRRAGITWTKPDAFCTMAAPYRLGLFGSRRLDQCCAEIGVPYEWSHTALSDARAAAGILTYTIDRARDCPLPDPVPDWPDPEWTVPARLRTDPPPPRKDTTLGRLADQVGVPSDVDASDEGALAYLSLLDRVLEDRVLSASEVAALAETAQGWGIGATAARTLHRSYIGAMWKLARADGVVTANELHDLRLISDLLDVPVDADLPEAPVPVLPRTESLAGLSVCFTGGSVCTIGGAKLMREDQEELAAERGMIVLAGVSKKLDILVLADPDSRSGKAVKAAELGVRRMAEPAFWRALGVDID